MIEFCIFICSVIVALFYFNEVEIEQQQQLLENAQQDEAYKECIARAAAITPTNRCK